MSVTPFRGPQITEAVQLYRVTEAAEKLGVSRYYLYQLISANQLRSVDVGGERKKLRVRADDLQAFIEKRTSRETRSPLGGDAA